MLALEVTVALAVPLAVVLPHFLALHQASPPVAALVWICTLTLRALVAIGGAIFVVLYLPHTGIYDAIARW